MDTASNTSVKPKALHFTEALADAQDDAGLEDLILDAFPDFNLYDAEYHEEEYTQDGGRYVDIQMHLTVPHPDYPNTILRHTFILDEDEWLVEAPGTQYGYIVMSDRKYRELNK